MIYVIHYNSATCRVFCYFKTRNRSLPCWMLSYARIYLLSQKNNIDLIAGSTVTRVTLRLPSHVLIATKWRTLHTVIMYLKSSHIRRLAPCYKAIVKITTSSVQY